MKGWDTTDLWPLYSNQPHADPSVALDNVSEIKGERAKPAASVLFFFLIATLFIYLFIYLFIFGCVGSSFHARAFSSCGKQGPLFIAVCRPLTIAASLVAEHRLQTSRLNSCGSRAQSLRGMWDLPRPGLEPVSPALAGRSSTTAPPGKPCICSLWWGR